MENELILLWFLYIFYKKYFCFDVIKFLYKKKFGNMLELDFSYFNVVYEYNGSVVCFIEYNMIWLENSFLVEMKWVWLIIMLDLSIGFIL